MPLKPKAHRKDTSVSLHPLPFEEAIGRLASVKPIKRMGSQAEESGRTKPHGPATHRQSDEPLLVPNPPPIEPVLKFLKVGSQVAGVHVVERPYQAALVSST